MSAIQLLSELRLIFPQESLENLKRAASFFKNNQASLEDFVRKVLDLGSLYFTSLPNEVDAELENFLRVQFQTLEELLPDAEQTFLKDSFDAYAGTSGGLEAFIMEIVVHQSYPKKIVRASEVIFDVKLYFELVPDPVGSFSHKNYIMTEVMSSEAIDYLVKIFGENNRAKIAAIVEKDESLYLSYKKMREIGNEPNGQFCTNIQTSQPKTFNDAPDYGQIFEKLFIENEGVILSFLSKKCAEDAEEYKQQERNQTLLVCGICVGLTASSKMIKICNSGHEMCSKCVKEHTTLLYHGAVLFFPCTFNGCKMLISNAVVRSVWDSNLYSKLLMDRINDANKGGDVVRCPFCIFLNANANKAEIFCINCAKKFCVTCKRAAHTPFKCYKREDDLCKQVEESMTNALVRKCPRCERAFIKEPNCCNRVQCDKCKAYICYVCRKILNDDTYKHFYGQGVMPSEAPECCPLHSDINTLHVNSVIDTGKRVMLKLKSENPNIQLLYDPLAVLPEKQGSDAVPNQF